MKAGISIVVCCYNSCSRLPPTLHHLAKQEMPEEIPWEVIVVDNNSTDHTAECAATIWNRQRTDYPLKVVYEAKPGLSHARICGVLHARYEYIVFCDDDNWLRKDYCAKAYAIMQQSTSLGALGGCGRAVTEHVFPDWFRALEKWYAVGSQEVSEEDGALYGAGLVVRKSVIIKLLDIGFEFLLTGRKKRKLSGGEDTELIWAIRIAGYHIAYSSELRFEHFISRERLEWQYFRRMNSPSKGLAMLILTAYRHHFERRPANWVFYLQWLSTNILVNGWIHFLLLWRSQKTASYQRAILFYSFLKYAITKATDYFRARKQIAAWTNRLK